VESSTASVSLARLCGRITRRLETRHTTSCFRPEATEIGVSAQMGKPTDLVQGTLDLLILKTIALAPMPGWGIAQRIRLAADRGRTDRSHIDQIG
jgi:hypothetical protein